MTQRELAIALNAPREGEVEDALLAYPQFRASNALRGVWLVGKVQAVADLADTATIALHLPHDSRALVQAWAWWDDGVLVGPRHTNSDGSICSHEPTDRTWVRWRGLQLLLDLHSAWLARHLFLRAYGRWPGRQRIHHPIERLVLHQPGEFCGCGSDLLYSLCCHDSDRHAVPERQLDRARQRGELMLRKTVLPPVERAISLAA